MSHTSGPWHINRDEEHLGVLRIEDKSEILAYIDQGTADLDAEDEANARLIAASPMLLEALKVLLESPRVKGYSEPSGEYERRNRKAQGTAYAAIGKAEG